MAKKQNGSIPKAGQIIIIAAAILLTLAVVAAGIIAAVQKKLAARPQFIEIEKNGNLLIPYEKIKYGINFFPVKYDGMKMGVIAYMDHDGIIYTALDASEVCAGSGKGYFEYDSENNVLVCQNCGKPSSVDLIGSFTDVDEDVCAPYPIIDRVRFDTADAVVISGETIEAQKGLFEDWSKYD